MTPDERPANENKRLGEPGYLSPRAQRIENILGLIGIAVGAGCILFFAKPSTLWTIAITVGVGFVVMVVAGLWRALIGGRP